MLPEVINSDTMKTDPSPFPENAFVVRSIVRGWNATMGHEEWQLSQQSKANQTQDKRYCVVDEKHPLFQAIVTADPRAKDLQRTFSRDLLPTYRVVVKGTGRYCTIEKYAAMPIQKAEQQRMDDRLHFDELDDLRLELGLGRAEADDLIRHNFSNDEWWTIAAQAMRDLATTKAARVKSTEIIKVAEQPENLSDWFPRDTPQGGKTVIITDEMINEHELDPQKALFAIPNHLVKSYGDWAGWHVRQIFGAALDLWLKEHNQDTKQAWRLALQYEFKNPGMASTENDDAQNAPEQHEIEASAIPVPETVNGSASAPALRSENSNPKGVSDMPIGQLKVYPVDFGSIWYKGIKFSVTLEAGGTFDQAIALMDEFAAHKELIAPNCLVPSNVTTMQPATNTAPSLPTLTQSAPAATPAPTSSEPDGKGRVPGQRGTTNVTGVKKTVNDGKVIIELWSTGQYAEHLLRQDGEHAMIAALGIRLDQLEIGTKYPCNWIADWVVSQNRSTAGKQLYFRDVTGIRDNGVALPKAS